MNIGLLTIILIRNKTHLPLPEVIYTIQVNGNTNDTWATETDPPRRVGVGEIKDENITSTRPSPTQPPQNPELIN
jgi:hypothetical protein